MITSTRFVACGDLWPWPISSKSFDLVLTWDPSWLNSVGNHEAAGGGGGVSSERRRSPQNAGVLVLVFPVIDSGISNNFALHKVVSLNFMSISFYWSVLQFLYMLNKEKNIPSGQNARHYLGQNAHARGRLTPQFFQLEYCHKLAMIVAMDTSNSIYMSDMEMQPIFLHTLIESLASIHDIIPGI